MNVGPAACILLTRNSYHQIAPHLSPLYLRSDFPTRSIGMVMMTGKKRQNKCVNLPAVNRGSQMCSRNRDDIREIIDIWGSAGDPIMGSLVGNGKLGFVHGIRVGDEKTEAL